MMKQLAILSLPLLMVACSDSGKTLDHNKAVDADFYARVAEINAPEYFEVFADSASMTPDMLNSLKFLYAYMPVPDITDYPGDYFKENVAFALRAREEMPWGKTVPTREFLHFVLPVRVNNENLDGHRKVFYEELRDRISGMSMADAILEVNHWCHEKAAYEPSDSRTHSPLATVCSAIGRCGEESTFTVAALRAVGIPARQVYTPRWAHTDDNHAWVEAWADGQWHFLGACEPEAVLDLGWFNDPASRGMLMNTRTPGRYDGPEEKLLQKPDYTDINVTENYAAVDTLVVKVVDADGNPVEDATVDFRLYNYGEFYPIASKVSDTGGNASLVAGLGDLIVWVSKDSAYAMQQATVGIDRNLSVTLTSNSHPEASGHYDIVPPPAKQAKVEVPQDMAAENNRRKAYEDSIRMAYVATFVDDSRGNAATITEFIASLEEPQKDLGSQLVKSLTEKDRTDVTIDVLQDAMLVPTQDDPMFVQYVLSPRIEKEFLVPFRAKFADAFSEADKQAFRANPASWAQWVTDNIKTDLAWQPSTVRMSPWSVWNLKRTNEPSRNVFFVAGARALGIPARIDEVNGKPQYYANGKWNDMLASVETGAPVKTGKLTLKYTKSGNIDDPNYYTHFTISKIENGRPVLLNYPEDATWSNTFAKGTELDEGEYMLITGQRLADGGVLVSTEIFTIAEGDNVTKDLNLRQDSNGVKVLGNFNAESMYYDLSTNTEKSIISTTGRGYYILGIVSAIDEPSNHALRDITAKKAELEKLGLPMIILFPTKEDEQKCTLIDGLKDIATLGIDTDGRIRAELIENMHLGNRLPIFVIADTFNRVVFVSQGYSIGLGQSLLDTASKL